MFPPTSFDLDNDFWGNLALFLPFQCNDEKVASRNMFRGGQYGPELRMNKTQLGQCYTPPLTGKFEKLKPFRNRLTLGSAANGFLKGG